MAVSIPAGFLVINTDPIDGRMLVANAAERKNTSTYDQYNSFHGLLVFEQSTNKLFALLDPLNVTSDSSWEEIGSSGSGSGTPGGSNTQIQFNDGDAFGGDPRFIFEKTTGLTQLSGSLQITGSTDNIFLIKSGSVDLLRVSSSGAIVFGDLQHTPPPVVGGFFYSSSAFYVGVE